MNIGNIKPTGDGRFIGRIASLTLNLQVALVAVNSTNERAPAFDIFALGGDRRTWVKVGALWEFSSNDTGEVFLSGRIDDPSLDKPIDVALFRQQDGSYNVAWRRPQRRSSVPSAPVATGDELPPLPGETDGAGHTPPADGLGESTAPEALQAEGKSKRSRATADA